MTSCASLKTSLQVPPSRPGSQCSWRERSCLSLALCVSVPLGRKMPAACSDGATFVTLLVCCCVFVTCLCSFQGRFLLYLLDLHACRLYILVLCGSTVVAGLSAAVKGASSIDTFHQCGTPVRGEGRVQLSAETAVLTRCLLRPRR